MTTKNLSVFFIKDVGTSLSSPQRDNSITQITYQRPSYDDGFRGQTGFRTHNTITFPTGGIAANTTPCVVNQKGADGQGGLILFVRTTGASIAYATSNNGGNNWSSWTNLPGTLPGGISIASDASPVASTYALDRVALIVRGSDNQLYRQFFTGGIWNGWVTSPPLGSPSGQTIVGDPAITGFPDNNYRVYVRTANNNLWYRTFTNGQLDSTWSQIANATATFSPEGVDVALTEPSATQLDDQEEKLNLFYPGASTEMLLTRFASSGVINNTSFGGGLTSAAGAAYYRDVLTPPNIHSGDVYHELHTFVRGNDKLLYGRYATILPGFSSVTLSPDWYSLPAFGRSFTKPDAVTWDGTVIYPPTA